MHVHSFRNIIRCHEQEMLYFTRALCFYTSICAQMLSNYKSGINCIIYILKMLYGVRVIDIMLCIGSI